MTNTTFTQRAVIVQVLRDDHDARWSCAELEEELLDCDPPDIGRAIERLKRDGVLETDGEKVRASGATKTLDALGLIGI